MLYEDQVVSAVRHFLEDNEWKISSWALATQTGDDIVAKRSGQVLRVEAKGGTSSNPNSSRYGWPFTLGQCKESVGAAVFRALRFHSEGDVSAVAFPDTPNYHRAVRPVLPALRQMRITVFLVNEDNGAVGALA